jgi:quercetin dioxygenase-like cupin family protein
MTNSNVRSPRVVFLPPKLCGLLPSAAGVALHLMELETRVGQVPFRGGLFTVEPGATSRPDTHAVTELWMVARGRGTLTYAGETLALGTGDWVLYDPHHTHQIHNDGPEELAIYALWWDV